MGVEGGGGLYVGQDSALCPTMSVSSAVTLGKQRIPFMFYFFLFAFSPGDMTATIFNPNIRCHNMSYKVK